MGLFRIFRDDKSADRIAAIERQCLEILGEVKALNERVATIARREGQLRALLSREAELDSEQARLTELLGDPATAAHVARAVARGKLHLNPCPYAVVEDLLPKEVYAAFLRALPPVELFNDRPFNKQQLTVPFDLAPTYSQRAWTFLADVAVPDFIVPAVVDKFRGVLDDWIAQNWPEVPPGSVQLHSSDGRIILRGRGYRIPPHRDPKWAFITCILYLARRHDSEAWGTQLYSVNEDEEARGAAPHWIDPARCRPVADVTFKPNRMLVFLNSTGAHGASIANDAPENLERYIYQFRIAPTVESMSVLKSTLPEERRPFWAGKSADY